MLRGLMLLPDLRSKWSLCPSLGRWQHILYIHLYRLNTISFFMLGLVCLAVGTNPYFFKFRRNVQLPY